MDMLDALRHGAALGRTFLQPDPGPGLTYAQALARAGDVAAALVKAGVQPGDRVALQADKSPDALLIYMACLRTGAVFLPLNPAYTPAETRYFLHDADVALFLASPSRAAEMAADLPANASRALPDFTAGATPADFIDAPFTPDTLAAILYTSGTTGRSKGVMLSRANLSSNADTLAAYWAFTPDDVLLHALPVFHTHGLFVATNTVLAVGASMIFLPSFTPDSIFTALPRATTMMGVPTFYTRLLADPRLTRDATAHIRLFVSGSAPLSAATHRDWEIRTGQAILERYGMTETNMNTSNPYAGPRRAGTVGLPLPGVQVRVTDPATGTPLPQGEVGLIEVRGPNVFSGYWRAPEKTAAEFRPDGFFMTGDMGAFDADGYLSIVGRSKDLVITGGLNVYPAEVETALDDLPGVAASAVIGVPHPDFGEAVVALVIPRPGAEPTEETVRDALRTRLAAFKLPKRVIVVDDFPRNAMGKVQKNLLRDAHAGLFSPSGT
jgi:malonyl-CoA/methylmalonyl-CoA synthetase